MALPRVIRAGMAKDVVFAASPLDFLTVTIRGEELDVEPEAPASEGNEGAEYPVWDISLSGIVKTTSTSA